MMVESNFYNDDLHPELGELEALRTGEAKAEIQAHVQDCAHCRERLAKQGTG